MHIKQLFQHWTYSVFAPGTLLREKYNAFKTLLKYDNISLELVADLEELVYGQDMADPARANWLVGRLAASTEKVVQQLLIMSPSRYMDLPDYFKKIDFYAQLSADLGQPDATPPFTLSFDDAAELPHLVGGKAHNLARAVREGIPAPPGFVISATAFNYYIEANELRTQLERRLRQITLSKHDQLVELTHEMQELVLGGEVPRELAGHIVASAHDLVPDGGKLAIRSSALAEDGEVSFAGQYASELNVELHEILEAYKRVLAGKYCPRAISYRIRHGLSDQETAMAVLVQPMLDAEIAGVAYTDDPGCKPGEEGFGERVIGIYAVPGLGEGLVDGTRTPHRHVLTRDPSPSIHPECPPSEEPLLDKAVLKTIGGLSLQLEGIFNAPQDVEWAIDDEGEVFILQSRQLQRESEDDGYMEPDAPLLYEGLERASGNAGTGKVFRAETGRDFALIPDGAVVVTPSLKPALAQFITRIKAVVSATGSRASHFSSVAREHRVPVVVGMEAANRLEAGHVITVDGRNGAIYEGRVEELLPPDNCDPLCEPEPLPRYRTLASHTVKLNLTDPESEDFSPDGCRSMHDLVRFCHEKSVGEMFGLIGKGGRGLGAARKLKTDLPLIMYVLDIDNGLFPMARDRDHVTPDDVKSRPMWALWYGLSDSRVKWHKRLQHMDWEEFDRVASGIFRFDSKLLASYSVISEDYMHLMVRFGYHFSVVDSICGNIPNENYVNFRFKGGGAGYDKRLLRLTLIRRALEAFGFECSVKGDMLDARSGRDDENKTRKQLVRLGFLLASTRLMDMALEDEEAMEAELERILGEVMTNGK